MSVTLAPGDSVTSSVRFGYLHSLENNYPQELRTHLTRLSACLAYRAQSMDLILKITKKEKKKKKRGEPTIKGNCSNNGMTSKK